ncbi:hypothetical protein MNEG_3976 [Monoraphidium neglectum]|uniref:Uncharacterized protein n=1 Tax=Monoraphidium neglectum TaxID=145388 RepID=A0A0D2LB28_9CHLO|nr:hypothetical protein MNEG_3976 [Monoraphidium neglectum]KIZ03974.1 hypothetical protein MNEG_3976 [Monoraphidium neglectum]|eukprot:XP_013902993.1 hypothetical protein MNEG_3976 [Monoraphidium neglectum]
MRAEVPPSPSGGAGGDGRASPLPALLAPRSAHQDRRLIRRMALMQGAIEVDRGSDDGEASLLAGLPASDLAAAALERAERQAPFCQVGGAAERGAAGPAGPLGGAGHRRITRDGRPQYDDNPGGSGGGAGGSWRGAGAAGPAFDLRSVAESVRQVGRHSMAG